MRITIHDIINLKKTSSENEGTGPRRTLSFLQQFPLPSQSSQCCERNQTTTPTNWACRNVR